MPANKTRPTRVSVAAFLKKAASGQQLKDCQELVKLFRELTGKPATMWGPSIVGFGSYHYRYESGHEGDMCVTGFSSRKPNISIYILARGPEQQKLLARLGKHKMAKACLYVRRMKDVDVEILRKLVVGSIRE